MELSESYRLKIEAEAQIAEILQGLVEATGRRILVLHVHEGLDCLTAAFDGKVSGTGIVFNDNLAGIMSGDFDPELEDITGECPHCEKGKVVTAHQDPSGPLIGDCEECSGTGERLICYECKGELDDGFTLCTGCQDIIEAEQERKS